MNAGPNEVLILGIGNLLMGDEGVGVRVIEQLQKQALPRGVCALDGGTGSFLLLEPMQRAHKVILIDATIDGLPPGSVRRLRPRYAKDYPRTLTAHDIGLKDLIDAFYLLGDVPDVTLYAVSIAPLGELSLHLSHEVRAVVADVAQVALDEASFAAARASAAAVAARCA
jgi:hydrogenase maturation protease